MRLNKFIALHSDYSRRAADGLIEAGRVTVNGQPAKQGSDIADADVVSIDGKPLQTDTTQHITIMLHKPKGYVCSRNGQGSKTIYDLLPQALHRLNPVGRLDKDSSGLLLLTTDGELSNNLTHPRYHKVKEYSVILDKPLQPLHQQMISDIGLHLEDGRSQLHLEKLDTSATRFKVVMHEGRNRQIRRTFQAVNYTVIDLHRTVFGDFMLKDLKAGTYKNVTV